MARGCWRLALVVLLWSGAAHAQLGVGRPPTDPEGPAGAGEGAAAAPAITPARAQELLDAIGAATDLDGPTKDAALVDARLALESAQRREALAAETASLTQAGAEASARIEDARRELATPPAVVAIAPAAEWTADTLRAAVVEATAALDAARDELAALQAEGPRRAGRTEELPRLIQQTRDRLAELPAVPAVAPGAGWAERVRALARQAERELALAQVARDEAELASLRAREPLLPLRRDLAQRRADAAQRRVEGLQAVELELQQAEAQRAAREAARIQRDAALVSPQLREIADELAALTQERTAEQGVVSQLGRVREQRLETQTRVTALRDRATSTAAKVRAAGLTDAVGLLLRTELASVPDAEKLALERKGLARRIAEAQYRLIVVEEQLALASDTEALVPGLVASIVSADSNVSEAVATAVTREVLSGRAEALRALRADLLGFVTEAADLDSALRTLSEIAEDFESYIRERILWTQSVPANKPPSLDNLATAGSWLLDARAWVEALGLAWRSVQAAPTRSTSAAVLWLALILGGVLAKRAARDATAKVKRFQTDHVGLTLLVIGCVAVRALRWPGLVWLAAAVLAGAESEHAAAVVPALRAVGVAFAALEFLRLASGSGGLAEVHFRWAKEGLVDFARHVSALELLALPLVLVFLTLGNQSNDLINYSLGRLAFVAAMGVLAWFLGSALAPWRPFVGAHLRKSPTSMAARLRWLWYGLLVAMPLALIVAAALGYYYTAVQLDHRLQLSMALVAGMVLINALALRALFVVRRRVLVDLAKQKRAAAGEAAQRPAESAVEADAGVDVPDLDAQSRRVLRGAVIAVAALGLYALWADILPALRMLERVQLWPAPGIVEIERAEAAPAPPPEAKPATTEGAAPQPISPAPGLMAAPRASASEPSEALTLAEVGMAALVVVLTILLTRNLPGMVELILLNRLPLDAGTRFAITAVMRYIIGVLGVLLAFSLMGIGWSKVQWLVAALTFGLAFGLQEIFANFISGLIILGERPIRVGDTVTVNGTTGVVTQIRMRATTVRDWELRELVVPNKVFITDPITNWTLADPRTRVTLAVGVAYDTDARLVERTLLEVARTEPNVLADPAPRALFVGFGDSTLNFELRAFLSHTDHMVTARSNLHMRVLDRFRELGITIDYPQLDVHITRSKVEARPERS